MEKMTQEQFNSEVEGFKKEINRMIMMTFEEKGEIMPAVFTYTYKPHTKFKDIGIMEGFAALLGDPQTKAILVESIRESMDHVKPIVTAFVCEGWGLQVDPKKLKEEGTTIEEVQRKLKDEGVAIKDHPDREEVVLVGVETYNMHADFKYVIDRSGDKPVLKLDEGVDGNDWVEKDHDKMGAMQNMLTKCHVEIIPTKASKLN